MDIPPTPSSPPTSGGPPRWLIREGRLRATWRVLLYLLAWLIAQVFISAIAGVILVLIMAFQGIPPEQMGGRIMGGAGMGVTPATFLSLQAVMTAATVVVTWLFRRLLDRQSFTSLGFRRSPRLAGDMAMGVGLGVGLFALVFLVEWATGWVRVLGFAWDVQTWAALLAAMLVFLLTFLLTGLNEELHVRGYIMQNLAEDWGMPAAVVVSSIYFGLLHSFNPNVSLISIANLALAGVLFAIAYLVTGNLWLPMALHFAWNFAEGPLFGFPVSGMDFGGLLRLEAIGPGLVTGGAFGPEAGLAGLGAVLLGIVVLWGWGRWRH
jgi:membrane protease YdiL (CAAX protease family)